MNFKYSWKDGRRSGGFEFKLSKADYLFLMVAVAGIPQCTGPKAASSDDSAPRRRQHYELLDTRDGNLIDQRRIARDFHAANGMTSQLAVGTCTGVVGKVLLPTRATNGINSEFPVGGWNGDAGKSRAPTSCVSGGNLLHSMNQNVQDQPSF